MSRGKEFISKYNARKIEELFDRINDRPIYIKYVEGYWCFFSCEANYELWAEDNSLHSDLLLGQIEGHSPREIIVRNLVYSKNINKGDTGTTIDYSFSTEEYGGGIVAESVNVTYVFQNDANSQSVSAVYAAGTNVSFNVDRYLRDGMNTITIFIRGRQTGTMTTKVVNYNVIELTVESNFDVSTSIAQGSSIPVFYRTKSSYARTVHFAVDGVDVHTEYVSANANQTNFVIYSIPNTFQAGKHTLQLYATMELANGGESFYSKTLYYEFIIRGQADSKAVMVELELPKHTLIVGSGNVPTINAEQYMPVYIKWGYYTTDTINRTANIQWKLTPAAGGEGQIIQTLQANVIEASTDTPPDPLQFVPTTTGSYKLQAFIAGTQTKLAEYNMDIILNTNGLAEITNALRLKLSALGRSNTEPNDTKIVWSYTENEESIHTTFNDMAWNASSGWDGRALVLSNGSTARINFEPFKPNDSQNYVPTSLGCTVEIEFETFSVKDESVEVIHVGDKSSSDNLGNISIKATAATMTSSQGSKITTNFRDNERVHLTFIILPTNLGASGRLMYIVNNGILERSSRYQGLFTVPSNGYIELGDATGMVGVKVYGTRCYYTYLPIDQAWSNSVVDDTENIAKRMDDNDIFTNGAISAEKVSTKLPTFLITGPLNDLISANSKTTRQCDCEYINPYDNGRNFTLTRANFRNHGQSTLGMPIPSIKFWSSKPDGEAQMYDADGNPMPEGRYAFKEGAMPMKKWVLQANYMDSTGCHNGSVLRLANQTWMNASVDGVYKLRTPPQKVAISMGANNPYSVRTSADSFPCCVFWRPDATSSYSFLGQYVFMDDKKSDYIYGCRSIYNIPNDPFAFFTSKTGKPKLWDNANTCQFEILRNTHTLALFQSMEHWDSMEDVDDESIGNIPSGDGDGEAVINNGWEQAFELIYPDSDDAKEEGTYYDYANVLKTFMTWICGTYQLDQGGELSKAAFQEEAEDHLDIYKLAAYYIFYLRFGLVDNVVRNAQLKTYGTDKNGVPTDNPEEFVWWLEFWDCDIANGKRNDGFLVFGPKIERSTLDTTLGNNAYAFAGHDCWLWNALESWPYWMNEVVPSVAKALYTGGLTYSSAIQMMDKEYCEKWCERIYNESGYFKYVAQTVAGASESFLAYLQGRGTSHRHWWLKTNFDYYDAKWCVGDYESNRIYLRASVEQGVIDALHINLTAATTNYFGWGMTSHVMQSGIYKEAGDDFTLTIDTSDGLAINDPLVIYAPASLSKVDLSEIAPYYAGSLDLERCNDPITGTYLEELILGVKLTALNNGVRNESTNFSVRGMGAYTDPASGISYKGLTALQKLNVRGIRYLGTSAETSLDLSVCVNLKYFYAKGTGMQAFEPADGTHFIELELPSTLRSIFLRDVTWDSISFSDPDTLGSVSAPVGLNDIVIYNIGSDNGVRDLLTAWAEAVEDTDNSDARLSQTNIHLEGLNLTGVSKNLLRTIAKIPAAQRILRGYVKVSSILSNDDVLAMKEAFGDDVFNRDNATFVIDGPDGIVIAAPSQIDAGTQYQLTAVKFPLTDAVPQLTWGVTEINGTHVSLEVIDPTSQNSYVQYNNFKLYTKTGLVTSTEDSTSVGFSVKVYAQDMLTLQSGEASFNIVQRTYPTSIILDTIDGSHIYNIAGRNYIVDAGSSVSLKRRYDPSSFTGSINTSSWTKSPSSDQYTIFNVTGDGNGDTNSTATLSVIKLFDDNGNPVSNFRIDLRYSAIFANSSSLQSALKTLYLHYRQPILTQLSNAAALLAMRSGGKLIFNPTGQIMYDLEALNLTDLDVLTGNTTLEHFEELNNFINLTDIDLSGCTLLGSMDDIGGHVYSRLVATDIVGLVSVDLTGTQVKAIDLYSDGTNDALQSIKYGAYTEEITLVNHPNLELVEIEDIDNLDVVFIDNCDSLTEIYI